MATTLLTRRRKDVRRRPVNRALVAFLSVYGLVSVGLAFVVISEVAQVDIHHWLPWPLITLAVVCADFIPVPFNTGGESLRVDLFGVPILVGAVFTSPTSLLISVMVGVLAGTVIRRESVERGVFNVINVIVGTSLARLVLAAMVGSASPTGVRGVVGLTLMALTFEVTTMAGVLGAVTLSGGRPDRRYLANVATHVGLAFPLSAVLGIVTVTVGLVETWGMALLVGPALILALWYRTASTTRNRYSNLQELYNFTVKLAGLLESEQIVDAALTEARTLTHSKHVELRMPQSLGGVLYRLEGDQVVQVFDEMTGIERSISDGRSSLIVPRGRREPMPSGYERFGDLMAVAVRLGDVGTAVMVAAECEMESETFDAEDLRFFEAFAANLGTSLTSSQRLDRLHDEVAAREHQALHDTLTGLANRTLFSQWVVEALAQRRPQQKVAVVLMDLDGFKDINDTLGHHTGDSILKEVGGRVLAAVGGGRLAARLGGDEFAFVIPAATSEDEVLETATEILESVSRPVAIDGLVLELRASVGVALAPHHGTDAATLLRRADIAMYSAKSAKRGIVAYNQEIDQNTKRRLILATELRHAMYSGALEVWYQPIADLATGEILSFEALLRWRHSDHGAISPNEFIPVAEQSGLIEPLTWWVMEMALREVNQWRRDGYELGMAVNVSARSLLGPEIVDRLAQMLSDIGVPATDLTLEITESLMMVDSEASQRILTDLADLGVRIAIDDFGTGYSSLSRLKKLPVQTVKVDRSFVLSMHRDEADEAIVRATIQLARSMGHTVIAEGVEQQATWERLYELGCDQVQGHLLAAAMPSKELRRWLKSRQAPKLAPIRSLPSAERRGA